MTAKELKKLEGLPDRLRTLKSETGKTWKEFADAIGTYDTHMNDWVNKGVIPSVKYLVAISKYYNVTSDWLLGLSDTPTTDKGLKAIDGLSDRIRMLIFNSGDSLKEFADAIKVYPSHVDRWINGGATPTAKYLVAICRYYDVSADWLLGLSDVPIGKKELKRVDCLADRIWTVIFESTTSYKKFADAIEVDPHQIFAWTNGKSFPSARYLCAICRYYGVTSDWLLGLTDERGW